jgi:hypothetical protein
MVTPEQLSPVRIKAVQAAGSCFVVPTEHQNGSKLKSKMVDRGLTVTQVSTVCISGHGCRHALSVLSCDCAMTLSSFVTSLLCASCFILKAVIVHSQRFPHVCVVTTYQGVQRAIYNRKYHWRGLIASRAAGSQGVQCVDQHCCTSAPWSYIQDLIHWAKMHRMSSLVMHFHAISTCSD